MPQLRYVALYPPTGHRDEPWVDDPAVDLLVRSARRVAEALSRAVTDVDLHGAAEVRVFAHPAPAAGRAGVVEVEVHLDRDGPFESAVAHVPAQVAALGPADRAELALAVLAGVLGRLGPERGWAEVDLDRAVARVREERLEFGWSGPWQASPDRRLEARGTYWLEDDGFGSAVLEVRPRGGDEVVRTPPAPAFCTAAGFDRSARTLRWSDGAVTLRPSVGLLGHEDGLLRWTPDSTGSGASPGRRPDPADRADPRDRPVVEVVGVRDVPDEPEVRYLGGGPAEAPEAYLRTLATLLHALQRRGVAWWAGADRALLTITWAITDDRTGTRVRRLADRVTAAIERERGSFASADPVQLARGDVEALVAAVTRRMGLSDPPHVDDLSRPLDPA